MKTVLLKSGEYSFSNALIFRSLDVSLVGEEGTTIVPGRNVVFMGVGDRDIRCFKCGTYLAVKIGRNQLQNLSFRCWNCGYETEV